MNLEQNPNKQAELEVKKKKLTELETKSKELIKPLPIETQITILQKEIQALTSKSTKTKVEEVLLVSKRKELEKLLKKQNNGNTTDTKPSNKTFLCWGIGITVLFTLLLTIITLVRNHRRRKLKKWQ